MPRFSSVIVVGILGAYVVLAAANIERPGLEADEALHAAAAIRLLQPDLGSRIWVNTTSRVAGRDLPVMIMPYLGAVKSYMLAAAFLLFGSSVSTLRLTMIAVGAAAIAFTYLLARRGWGSVCALITTAALATDPSFVLMTRADWGPVALPALFRTGALYAIIVWAQERKRIHLGIAGLLLGLGVYDKSNFLWFVLALIAVGLGARLLGRLRLSCRELLLVCGTFLAGASPLLWWNATHNWQTITVAREGIQMGLGQGPSLGAALLGELSARMLSLWSMLAGRGLDVFMFGASVAPWVGSYSETLFLPVLAVSVLLVGLFFRGPRMLHPLDWPTILFPAAMAVLLLAQMLITPLTIWYHHLIFLYPFPQLFIGVVLSHTIVGFRPGAWRAILRPVAGLAAILLILGNGAVTWRYQQLMARSPGSPVWSTGIYSLNDLLMTHYRQEKIKLLDWGMYYPLLLLSDGQLQVDELWGWLEGPDARPFLESELQASCAIFVLSAPGTEVMKDPGQAFLAAASASGRQSLIQRLVEDDAGRPRYMLMDFEECPQDPLAH